MDLLDYADPFAPKMASDVDFRDVFGGPPRRGSVYEPLRERADSLDVHLPSRGRGGLSGEEIVGSYRRSSLGLGEKQVFGESSSPARRRHLGDDFFSDIFPGSDSSCSTPTPAPRRSERGAFASSPGSRVLSPTRIGGSALPAQFSFSMKFTKEIDHAEFNSPTHSVLHKEGYDASDLIGYPSSPNASMPIFTNQAAPSKEEPRNEVHASHQQSPLSREFTRSLNRLFETTGSASFYKDSQSKNDPANSESYSGASGRFHFSIFKWAGKGASLVLSPDWKSRNQSRIRALPEVVVQGADITFHDDKTSSTSRLSNADHERKSMKDHRMEQKGESAPTLMEDLSPYKYELKNRRDATESAIRLEAPLVSEELRSELRNLREILDDESVDQGNESTSRQHEDMEDSDIDQRSIYSDVHVKQHDEIRQSLRQVEATSPKIQDAPASSENKVGGRKVKGKVKEFIKIFNQDVSSKLKGTVETQDQKSRTKDGKKRKVEGQRRAHATKTTEDIKVDNKSDDWVPVTPFAVNPTLNKAEDSDSNIDFDVHIIDHSSSARNETSMPDSAPGGYEYSVDSAEEPLLEDIEECLVEPSSKDQHISRQTETHEDLVQIADSKIREWSKGKVGNIRSLLSTLQYVLWPESGWKPVPLVDIIEGGSVKRAYQKALLCLHPDKLQQRGAAMHQKHIAEKVFDILQEAWDHFNSASVF